MTYDELSPAVKAIVNRRAAELVAREWGEPCTCTLACIPQGITDAQACRERLDVELNDVREALAARVTTTTNRTTHGTGH